MAVVVPIDDATPIWQRVFTVAPLAVVGTREGEGYDLAPKHMVVPLGHGPYIGFVCTPAHATYRNCERYGEFTMSFVKPEQLVMASLAASGRVKETGEKPGLLGLPVEAAKEVSGVLLRDSYLQFECSLLRIVSGFGDNALIAGRIIAAYADEDAIRVSDADEQRSISESPLLVYVHPGRFAEIRDTKAFPFASPGYD